MFECNVKEELSYAYVHAVAARAGMGCNRIHPDLDSGEVEIRCYRPPAVDSLYAPRIELQLKATAVDLGSETTFPYELKIKNYNDLRVKRHLPALLVVLALPKAETEWLLHGEELLISKRCAYWHNLAGAPLVDNTSTRTISISRKNIFSPDALRELMIKVSREEEIGNAL